MKKIIIMLAALTALTLQTAFAGSHAKSVNIALIPNTTGGGFGGGGAGTLLLSYFPGYNITIVDPSAVISAASLANYDTVILYQFCNINSYTTLTTSLVGWAQQYGGKILIWDSDSCGGTSTYTWLNALGAQFTRISPGQTGNTGGSITFVENNGLGSSVSSSPYYVNTSLMVSQTDAVGDLNVVDINTVAPVWCALMRGVNTLGQSGFAHMYTKIGALTGAPDALIIYCGFDTDFISSSGGGLELVKLFTLELAHGWGSPGSPEVADLTCQAPIGNLVLTPATALNPVPGTHTVTATVSIYNPSGGQVPQAGVTVTFLVTAGPNAGDTGSAVSDAQGHATFTYISTVPGTDTIQATATVNGVLKTATAQKTWCNPPTIISTIAGNRGYYRLTASSACYPATSLQVYIADSGSALVAGPFPSGQVDRIVKGSVASVGPGTATAARTIVVVGNAVAYAVDPLGSNSAGVVLKP
jgi:hypothetical protein